MLLGFDLCNTSIQGITGYILGMILPSQCLLFFLILLQFSGARRLRDAIVLGYQLQRAPGRDVCIPDWYANAENELGLRPGLPTIEMNDDSSLMNS